MFFSWFNKFCSLYQSIIWVFKLYFIFFIFFCLCEVWDQWQVKIFPSLDGTVCFTDMFTALLLPVSATRKESFGLSETALTERQFCICSNLWAFRHGSSHDGQQKVFHERGRREQYLERGGQKVWHLSFIMSGEWFKGFLFHSLCSAMRRPLICW